MKIKNNLSYPIIAFIIIDKNFGPEIEIQTGEEKQILLPEKYSFLGKKTEKGIEKVKILLWELTSKHPVKEDVIYQQELILEDSEIAREFRVDEIDSLLVSIRNSKYPYLSPSHYGWKWENDFDE